MQHPSQILIPEYASLLPTVLILPTRAHEVDSVVQSLLGHLDAGRYGDVSETTGVPFLFAGPSFEREAGSNFRLSPAQGDPIDRPSVHIPKNRGPFPDWKSAAVDAYGIDGLDKVGASNWTYELICYYGEEFNGFGYRDYHQMRTPYLWGATNLQQPGKYVADGKFSIKNPDESPLFDQQIGIVPMFMRICELRPSLRLAEPWPFAKIDVASPPPALASTGLIDAFELQKDLNALGYGPLLVDGNYGAQTKRSVAAFQAAAGIEVDGMAGKKTDVAIEAALAAKVSGG